MGVLVGAGAGAGAGVVMGALVMAARSAGCQGGLGRQRLVIPHTSWRRQVLKSIGSDAGAQRNGDGSRSPRLDGACKASTEFPRRRDDMCQATRIAVQYKYSVRLPLVCAREIPRGLRGLVSCHGSGQDRKRLSGAWDSVPRGSRRALGRIPRT